jgi:hypothetical protein
MLIVEDGTGVANAQSYVQATDVRAFAAARGIPVPSDTTEGTAEIEAKLISAMDYLETNICYQGIKTDSDQELSWPRKNVVIEGSSYPDNRIPKNLRLAQIRLAIEALNGAELLPTLSGRAEDYVVKEKVGPIETEFADPSGFSGLATFTAVDALLKPLLGNECSSGFSFKVTRG